MSTTGDLVSRIYSNFRGVDFRGEEVSLARSPDSLNMWINYKEIGGVRTRPGIVDLPSLSAMHESQIHGIFYYKRKNVEGEYESYVLIHQKEKLFRSPFPFTSKDDFVFMNSGEAIMSNNKSQAFVFDDKLYIIDGVHFYVYDGGTTVSDVVGYIPTTSIGRSPSGGGKPHEDVNLLSPWRVNTFFGDGESNEYYLDTQGIGDVEVEVDGVKLVGGYTIYYDAGMIDIHKPPAKSSDGQPNVKIKFKKDFREDTTEQKFDEWFEKKSASQIKKCTLCQVFDNRVFFSGNDNFPNKVWHCSLYDPTYWSDTDYYEEGLDSAKVKGLVAGADALMVFREPSISNTSIFYHRPVIDSEYGKIYPSQHSSVSTGCVGGAINFNDDIIFFSDRGMEAVRIDKITSEQVLEHRSSLVDKKMLDEDKYKNMILVEWEGYLLVFIGSHVYLADSRAVFNNVDHIEYEWFYWDIGFPVTATAVINGKLYLGLVNGAIRQMEAITPAEEIESYWTTPKDKFNAPNKLKTTNKNGCVVEATGDIEVLAKTDNDDKFESIGTYENVGDFVVSRIKKKKFKDIQLRFHSNTWFTLETATLECFVGGYIKRGGGE